MRKTTRLKFLAAVLLPLLAATTFPCVAGAQKKSDREQAELKGPVKTVEAYIHNYTIKEGRTEPGERRPWHFETYNAEGYVTARTSFNHLGQLSGKYVHTFDAKGRPTGYEEYSASADRTLPATPRRHVYTLDEQGRRVEYRVFDSDGSLGSRFTYEFDAAGRLVEDAHYYHTGQLGGRTVYAFDDKGNQTLQTYYDANGVVAWKVAQTFDEHGRLTERLQYQGDTLRYKITHRYDDKGRILETETAEFNAIPNVHTSHAPEPGKVVYTYDDARRTKEVAHYKPGADAPRDRTLYTYDERGVQTGRVAYGPGVRPVPTEIRFYDNIYAPDSPFRGALTGQGYTEMEYDSHGNWTKKTHLIRPDGGGPPQAYRAELRVITYH